MVAEDSDWNWGLFEGIIDTFLLAVAEFNNHFTNDGSLRYTWLSYIPEIYLEVKYVDEDRHNSYWDHLKKRICVALKGLPIVETQDGTLQIPESLMFMDWAKDNHQKPLFGHPGRYVSQKYNTIPVLTQLVRLGVKQPDAAWVLDELRYMNQEGILHDSEHGVSWHNSLARVILQLDRMDSTGVFLSGIRKLPLIPLQDGSWSCAPDESNTIHFPTYRRNLVPSDIRFRLVRLDVMKNTNTWELLQRLGVKDCTPAEVCNRILEIHDAIETCEPGNLIVHVRYIFCARDNVVLPNLHNRLWLVDQDSVLRRGTQLYASSAGRKSASMEENYQLWQLFAEYEKAWFLHPMYLTGLASDEVDRFLSWLKNTTGLANAPRVRAPQLRLEDRSSLHSDFKWLMRIKPDIIVDVMRAYWKEYEHIIDDDLCDSIGLHEVETTGEPTPLCQTFALTPGLQRICAALNVYSSNEEGYSFLLIPPMQIKSYRFLTHFNVGFEENIHFYLWVLCQKGYRDYQSIEQARQLYGKISERMFEDLAVVR